MVSIQLGCTNYNTRHCTNYMFPYNYTQEKDKILKTEDGKVYNNEFKSELKTIIASINEIYSKYIGFKFTYMCPRDFLAGKENKAITAFKLIEFDAYGIYSEKPAFFLVKLLGALFDYDVFDRVKDDANREKIIIKTENPSDETIIEIYNAVKWKWPFN